MQRHQVAVSVSAFSQLHSPFLSSELGWKLPPVHMGTDLSPSCSHPDPIPYRCARETSERWPIPSRPRRHSWVLISDCPNPLVEAFGKWSRRQDKERERESQIMATKRWKQPGHNESESTKDVAKLSWDAHSILLVDFLGYPRKVIHYYKNIFRVGMVALQLRSLPWMHQNLMWAWF